MIVTGANNYISISVEHRWKRDVSKYKETAIIIYNLQLYRYLITGPASNAGGTIVRRRVVQWDRGGGGGGDCAKRGAGEWVGRTSIT